MIITLLTDFGDADGYVGAMKGVIATRAPKATVVDLAHGLEPGDILGASEVLAATARWFPPETCHVVVVDPTVGSERRAVAVAIDDQTYVAPDNGVLSGVLEAAVGRPMGVVLDNPAFWCHPVSHTFHGRDIFAPVAAHLALGIALSTFGTPLEIESLVLLPRPRVEPGDGCVTGEIVRFDRYGNAICSLARYHLAFLSPSSEALTIEIDGLLLDLVPAYAAVPEGQAAAVIGSSGRLEIAVRGGSARQVHGLRSGQAVVVRPR